VEAPEKQPLSRKAAINADMKDSALMTQTRNLSVASAEFDATGERRDREIPRHFVLLPIESFSPK
jgi:hypothetical protein